MHIYYTIDIQVVPPGARPCAKTISYCSICTPKIALKKLARFIMGRAPFIGPPRFEWE